MCGPWYFGPGNEHNPNHAGSIAVVQDGGFKSVSGCFDIDDPELADIRKMEKM
jgi:branched-chain amino acid transport system substrate-binding protein